MTGVDRYDEMTVRELLESARNRPLSGRHRRKAELVDELRRMDGRRNRGEPEGDLANLQWRAAQAFDDLKAGEQQKAVELALARVRTLLDRPGRKPEYYEGVEDALAEVRDAPPPTDEQWSAYVEVLVDSLESLEWAGWDVPESFDSDFDKVNGPILSSCLVRTCMVIDVEYDCWRKTLRLLPAEEYDSAMLSMLDDEATILLTGTVDDDRAAVAKTAGALGLLDPTVLKAGPDSEVGTGELIADLYAEWVFDQAARYRAIPAEQLIDEVSADEDLARFLKVFPGFFAPDIVPDLVPTAVALGIAAWCWRNNTDVERHHLADDILMARVNMAVTRAVTEQVDTYEGVDWAGVEESLTSTTWTLPDGRSVVALFGEGWPDVERTVRQQVRSWQRIDETILGPRATMRLLSVAGATSYTRHWWGQGRWDAIVETIVTEAVAGGVSLPQPYGAGRVEEFLRDLREPFTLDDEVLDWLIDLPQAGADGPQGLRFNASATAPVVREFELWHFGPVGAEESTDE